MKTKKIISAMVQCISNKSCIGCIYEYDDNCHKAIMEDAKNRLMDYVAEIDGLKKNVEALRKELAGSGNRGGGGSGAETAPGEETRRGAAEEEFTARGGGGSGSGFVSGNDGLCCGGDGMSNELFNEFLKEMGIEPVEFPEESKLYLYEQSALVDEFIKKYLAISDKYGRDRNRDVWCMADTLKEFDYENTEIE